MLVDVQGRVAVVTGGSSGIGLATVDLLLGLGVRVAFCGRDPDRLRAAEHHLRTQHPHGEQMAVACDVLEQEQVEHFAALVNERFGGLDMLINNAGQARVSTFADTTDEAWREELDLKFFSIIRPTRAFLPLLEASESGAIVCVNSLLAVQPEPHMVCTSAARAGLLNLVHSMAKEFASKGVRVNSILLGLVESGQWRRRYEAEAEQGETWEQWTAALAQRKGIPLGRLGRPEEAARAIVFLATPASSFTTGAAIDVSGGLARHV